MERDWQVEMESARKRVIGLIESGATAKLDGKPAKVLGYRQDFANVCLADGCGGMVEFAWQTVERVLLAGGSFQS